MSEPEHVRVGQRLVRMHMVVPSCQVGFLVRVPVVFVMLVGVGVRQRFVLVQVPMHLPVKKEHPESMFN